MRIWFHGTDLESSELILKNGFKIGTFFARDLADALEFGGPYVFMVSLPIDNGQWQQIENVAVPEEAIVRLTHYRSTVLVDNPERREAVLFATAKSA